MADLHSGTGSQLAHATNALNYGHLGTALYQEESREWTFLRRFAGLRTSKSAFPFTPTERKTVYENLTRCQIPCKIHDIPSSSVRLHGLGHASANVKEEEMLSSAIIDSLHQYDPLLSDRLAFGSASVLLDNDVRSGYATVPVAALTSGTNGDSIIVAQIGTERVTVTDEHDKELVLNLPTITTSVHTSWTSDGEAVQQIIFAATTGYQSTWMAARLLSSTTLFHPLCHRRLVPQVMPNSAMSSGGASFLEANPILRIPISRTGGYSHADIAFHPGDCHLLALVDRHGNWSTWRIDGKRCVTSRMLFRIQLLRNGKLHTWENLRRPFKADPYHDGWHRICWAADDSGYSDDLFVTNRRTAVVLGSFDDEKRSINLGLGKSSESQWILDVRKSILHSGWIFVLTSTRVLCISTAENTWRDIPTAESNSIVCSWHHFRGRNDITLSLTILETTQCMVRDSAREKVCRLIYSIGTVILLWSRISELVNAYRVNAPFDHPYHPLTWAEPALLNLTELRGMPDVDNAIGSPSTIMLRPLQIQRPSKAPSEPLNLSLQKLFILQADQSVTEVILQSTRELSAVGDHNNSNEIVLPFRRDIRSRSSKYVDLEELDEFVVEEAIDVLQAYADLSEERHKTIRSEQDKSVLKTGSATNWQEVCDLVTEGSTNKRLLKRIDFDEYLQAVRAKVEESASSEPGVQLLSELSSPLPLVADIESSSATMMFLAERGTNSDQVSPTFYSLSTRFQWRNTLECYQTLMSHWLSPLPLAFPDRIRVDKERLVRQVAADLALAGTAIRPSTRGLETRAVEERAYPNSAPEAAVASTPSLNVDPADTAAHSQPAASLPVTAEEHAACLRLRTYVTVSDNAVTTAAPASVLGMLAHLPSDVDIDPSIYDWRATEATIAAERDEGVEKADPRARRRADKLAQGKRKRVQSQIKTAEELDRQRAPPTIGSSQMVLPTREVQSSQIVAPERDDVGDFGPMTQPERGAFGTRLGGAGAGRKDKGKKRAAGF